MDLVPVEVCAILAAEVVQLIDPIPLCNLGVMSRDLAFWQNNVAIITTTDDEIISIYRPTLPFKLSFSSN